MTLTPDERRWLDEEAQETLGLTQPRTRVLAAVLAMGHEPFSIRGVARLVDQAPELVRLALEMLVARELVDLQAIGNVRGPKASLMAAPGRRLRMIFGALRGEPILLSPPEEKKARSA